MSPAIRLRPLPGLPLMAALGLGVVAVLVTLIAGWTVPQATALTLAIAVALLAVCALDYVLSRSAWQRSNVRMTRRLPAAFAIGVRSPVQVEFTLEPGQNWRVRLHDHTDATLQSDGLPLPLVLHGGKITEVAYAVLPTRRGDVTFDAADVACRSRFGLWELMTRVGEMQSRRVYPDFAQVARYAWLAGDRRLAEIGIKTYRQRGEGTDFKQLSEYRTGDAVRHIDWKATLRFGKPIVREFQNERDQCVMLLLDCGRRMRADDRHAGYGAAHFDQVLNAVMLLTYVALKQGDAVGALTFGTPVGEERWFAPRKGATTLNALMGELFSVQPTLTHSDYLGAAQDLLRKQGKRSLVIVITNFRDEDSSELGQALRLLRSRHLVLTASLRESAVRELAAQPLRTPESTIEVASAHMYEQARRDAFNRIAARDALMVDAEPQWLGIELVNRYQAVKKAGLI
jgi:uncharacterized protein (DUF58 family)